MRKCRKSSQFNFSLHVKINHIDFEDKCLIKTHENVTDFDRRKKTAERIF